VRAAALVAVLEACISAEARWKNWF
jgi:hypothetical protein